MSEVQIYHVKLKNLLHPKEDCGIHNNCVEVLLVSDIKKALKEDKQTEDI